MTRTDKERMLVGYYRRASDFAAAVKDGREKDINFLDDLNINFLDDLKEEFRFYLYSIYDPEGLCIGCDIESDDLNAFLDAARAIDDEAEDDVNGNHEKSYEDAVKFVASLGLKDDAGC